MDCDLLKLINMMTYLIIVVNKDNINLDLLQTDIDVHYIRKITQKDNMYINPDSIHIPETLLMNNIKTDVRNWINRGEQSSSVDSLFRTYNDNLVYPAWWSGFYCSGNNTLDETYLLRYLSESVLAYTTTHTILFNHPIFMNNNYSDLLTCFNNVCYTNPKCMSYFSKTFTRLKVRTLTDNSQLYYILNKPSKEIFKDSSFYKDELGTIRNELQSMKLSNKLTLNVININNITLPTDTIVGLIQSKVNSVIKVIPYDIQNINNVQNIQTQIANKDKLIQIYFKNIQDAKMQLANKNKLMQKYFHTILRRTKVQKYKKSRKRFTKKNYKKRKPAKKRYISIS